MKTICNRRSCECVAHHEVVVTNDDLEKQTSITKLWSADRGTFGTHILFWEKKSSDEGSFSGIKEEYFIWMSRYIKKKTYFYFNVIFFISENGISIEQC